MKIKSPTNSLRQLQKQYTHITIKNNTENGKINKNLYISKNIS